MFNVKFDPYSHPPIFHGKISGGEAEKKEKKIPLDFTRHDRINLN